MRHRGKERVDETVKWFQPHIMREVSVVRRPGRHSD